MNSTPISAGGPIKDSIGRGKRIAKKVVKTVEKPNYKGMIKEKKVSIVKSLDNIIEKCGEVSKQGTTPRIVPIKKEARKFGGFKDIVGPKKIKPIGDKPIFFDKKPGIKPIAKDAVKFGKPMSDSQKAKAHLQIHQRAIYGDKKPKEFGELSVKPVPLIKPITKGKADWQTPPFPPGSPDLIKPIKPIKKSLGLQKAEDLIFLKADRLGHILSKDYEKVDDLTLVKGFGCIEKIPETMRKSSDTICKEFGLDKAYSIDAIDKELDSRK